jgi:prolyl-tRNA synthetase
MVIPPRMAPQHVVILPIIRKEEERENVQNYCQSLADALRAQSYDGRPVGVIVDVRDMNAGEKSWEWVKKGIPLALEIGPRDIANNAVFVGRRDKTRKERFNMARDEFISGVASTLDDIQQSLLARAKAYRDENTRVIEDWDEFVRFFTPQDTNHPEIHGGFALSYWCEETACEARINDELSVTIRCIPFDSEEHGSGKCIACGKEAKQRVVFAKSY